MSDSILDDMVEWKDAAKDYTEAQIHYFKLQMVENLSIIFSGMISKLIYVFLGLFALLFLTMGLSYYLGEIFGSNALGFITGGGIFILLILLFVIIKKPLVDKPIIESFIQLFFPEKINLNDNE